VKGGEQSDLFRAVMADMADNMNLAELADINKIFSAIDTDHSGSLTADEVRAGLSQKMPADRLEKLIAAMLGKDGTISYTAFMGTMLWKFYKDADADGDGSLSIDEVQEMIKRPAMEQVMRGMQVAEVMKMLDQDGDGVVTFEEFKAAMAGKPPPPTVTISVPWDGWRLGQNVTYYSVKQRAYFDARIMAKHLNGSIQIDIKPNYWFSIPEQKVQIMVSANAGANSVPLSEELLGVRCKYYSASYKVWVDCTVMALRDGGYTMIDCKPEYWLSQAEQEEKIKVAG